MRKITFRSKGVALFISVLMTMSLSIIALATMARVSEISQMTGNSINDRKLQVYAYSALNIVNGELRQHIDSTLDFADAYAITGGIAEDVAANNNGTFKYYPRDVSSPGNFEPKFAYRAVARKLQINGANNIYGISIDGSKEACYDVSIDVREVVKIGTDTNNIKIDDGSQAETSKQYSLGIMKTVGMVSCFTKGENDNSGSI